MIPGSVSKLTETTVASAATIRVRSDVVRITGITAINNIVSALGVSQGQLLILVATDGAVTLGTSGNILVGISLPQNRAVPLVFVKSLGKWVIGFAA